MIIANYKNVLVCNLCIKKPHIINFEKDIYLCALKINNEIPKNERRLDGQKLCQQYYSSEAGDCLKKCIERYIVIEFINRYLKI